MTNKTPKGILVFLIVSLIGGLVTFAAGIGGTQIGPVSVFLVCGIWAFAVNWLAFVPAFLKQTEKFYDLVGAFTNASTIWIAAWLSQPLSLRAMVVTVLVSVWAVRLGTFLFRRISRDGKDQRFDAIKPVFIRFLNTWTLQALWVVLTTAAALGVVTSGRDVPLGLFAYIGLALWVVGFGIEVIADGQKKAFRADPANKGKFITGGLWSWSRHPNYFGEILLWIGITVIALPVLQGWQYIVLISPIFVFLLLTRVSGIPMLEKNSDRKWGGEEDYEAYKRRTSVLFLRPPKAVG